MTEYVLSGTGIQPIAAGVPRVWVFVSTIPPGLSVGVANPPNYFRVGALRFYDGRAFGRAEYIDGDAVFFDVPLDTTEVAYGLAPGTVIHLFDA